MFADDELDLIETGNQRRVRRTACGLLLVFLCGAVAVPAAAVVWLWQQPRTPAAAPAAIAAAPAVDLAAEPTPSPLPEMTVNRLAVVDLDAQLITIAPDGRDRRALTSSSELFQFPAWSPDGTQIGAIANGVSGSAVLVIPDQDGGGDMAEELYRSRAEAPFYLYWSPNGRLLSFLANHPDEGIALYLGRVGAGTSRLLATGQPFYWHWLDDGQRLLIHSGLTGAGSRLALLDAEGDGSGGNLAQPGFFQAPGVSATGRFRAYAEVAEDEARYVVVESMADGGRTAEPHQGLAALTWSPTGDLLAYMAPPIPTGVFFGPLRVLDPANGQSRTLTREIALAFFWSPDGRQIAYLTLADEDGDSIQAVRTVAGRPVSTVLSAALQQDNLEFDLWVVEVESGRERFLSRFRPGRLFVSQFLPFFDQYALSHQLWSPRSDALALPMLDEQDRPGIFVVSIGEGQATFLTRGLAAFWSRQ